MQRYSGYVITLLPVGLAGILFLISPSYIDRHARERRRRCSGCRWASSSSCIGLISMGIGYLFIRRIVDIKV